VEGGQKEKWFRRWKTGLSHEQNRSGGWKKIPGYGVQLHESKIGTSRKKRKKEKPGRYSRTEIHAVPIVVIVGQPWWPGERGRKDI